MADDGHSEHEPTAEGSSASQKQPEASSSTIQLQSPAPAENRAPLLEQARAFLISPSVINEGPDAKRQFLVEKGLRDDEIQILLREAPLPQPAIPPRTYPQPPPSNLPYLLLGLTKIFSWITGCSAVLILVYYRFLLPRITRSALARRSLKTHQVALLQRLNTSLKSLKGAQEESFTALPTPDPHAEPKELLEVHSLDKLDFTAEKLVIIKPQILLRCALEEASAAGKSSTVEDVLAVLEQKFPWLADEEHEAYRNSLWATLTSSPCFASTTTDGKTHYAYIPPPPPQPTPLLSSLTSLQSSLSSRPTLPVGTVRSAQRTLEALADCTGYITTQTYQFASAARAFGFNYGGIGGNQQMLSPQQEEIRKEIKALKGLVLNRRTFAPLPPKADPVSPSPSIS